MDLKTWDCLEESKLENKINHLEKYKCETFSLRVNHKEFMKTIIQYSINQDL